MHVEVREQHWISFLTFCPVFATWCDSPIFSCIWGLCHITSDFTWALRIQIQPLLMLVQRVLCPLSHLHSTIVQLFQPTLSSAVCWVYSGLKEYECSHLPIFLCEYSKNYIWTRTKSIKEEYFWNRDGGFVWNFAAHTDETSEFNICWYLSVRRRLSGNWEVHVCTYSSLQPPYPCSMTHLGIHVLALPVPHWSCLYKEAPSVQE